MPVDSPLTTRPNQHRFSRFLALLCGLVAVLSMAAPVGPAQASTAQPVTPWFPAAIDGYRFDRENTCDPVAKPGALDVQALIHKTYGPSPSSYIERACSGTGTSGHHSGRAIDWMTNSRIAEQAESGDAFVGWLLATDKYGNQHAMARRLGMQYVIWKSRTFALYAPERGWTEYSDCVRVRTGPEHDNICHRNHVHMSLNLDGAHRKTSWWTTVAPVGAPHVADLAVTAVAPAVGSLVSRTESGAVVQRPWSGGALGGLVSLGGQTHYAPAVARAPDGDVDAAVVGTNEALYVSTQAVGTTSWSTWLKVPGPTLRSRPAAASWPDGTLHVFAAGTDNALWHTWRTADGRWWGWESLGGQIAPGAGVSVASAPDRSIWVTTQAADRSVLTKSWAPYRGWEAGWTQHGGVIVGDPAAAVDVATGQLTLTVRGTNDALYAKTVGGTPTTWQRVGGVLSGAPAVSAAGTEGVEVLVTGSNGVLYRIGRVGSTWGAWNSVR